VTTRYEHLAWAQLELNDAGRWILQAEALQPSPDRPGNPTRAQYFTGVANACLDQAEAHLALAERLPARCDHLFQF
jgi:hypothetical protein